MPQEYKDRQERIREIMEMDGYQELADCEALRMIFRQYFSYEALNQMSIDALNDLPTPKAIVRYETTLWDAICYGNGYMLTEEDIPSFASKAGFHEKARRLKVTSSGQNITNIPRENSLMIYRPNTVKSAKKLFDSLSIEETYNLENSINKRLAGKYYCISKDELDKCKDGYWELVSKLSYKQEKNTEKRLGHRLLKIAIAMTCLGITFAAYCLQIADWRLLAVLLGVQLAVGVPFVIWG